MHASTVRVWLGSSTLKSHRILPDPRGRSRFCLGTQGLNITVQTVRPWPRPSQGETPYTSGQALKMLTARSQKTTKLNVSKNGDCSRIRGVPTASILCPFPLPDAGTNDARARTTWEHDCGVQPSKIKRKHGNLRVIPIVRAETTRSFASDLYIHTHTPTTYTRLPFV